MQSFPQVLTFVDAILLRRWPPLHNLILSRTWCTKLSNQSKIFMCIVLKGIFSINLEWSIEISKYRYGKFILPFPLNILHWQRSEMWTQLWSRLVLQFYGSELKDAIVPSWNENLIQSLQFEMSMRSTIGKTLFYVLDSCSSNRNNVLLLTKHWSGSTNCCDDSSDNEHPHVGLKMFTGIFHELVPFCAFR